MPSEKLGGAARHQRGSACVGAGSASAAQRALQPVRPFGDAVVGVDHVLADFQERMDEAARLGMHRDGIAVPVAARIGLVVADDEAPLLLERDEERHGQARVLVPEHAHMPGPLEALEHRGEAVHRDEGGSDAAAREGVEQALDGAVIGKKHASARARRAAGVSA